MIKLIISIILCISFTVAYELPDLNNINAGIPEEYNNITVTLPEIPHIETPNVTVQIENLPEINLEKEELKVRPVKKLFCKIFNLFNKEKYNSCLIK